MPLRQVETRVSAVVLLSGGLDSAVLAYELVQQGIPLTAFSMRYGQKHAKEIEAASRIAESLEMEHQIVDLSAIGIPLFGGSSLTDGGKVPRGHHEAAIQKSTVIPNRNMVMIALATSLAIQKRCTRVYFASHLGDREIYNDCRREFLDAMGKAMVLADDHRVQLHFPYCKMSKSEIARRGAFLKVPFSETWTCYEGGDEPCGKCGACRERNEALSVGNCV
jgi:7-cyano-7-deazaguanine synthase